jgi:cytochrome c-type biogenesis protein CcmE
MKRQRVVVVAALIFASVAWVATKGLTQNLVYYTTPTEVLQEGAAAIGERARVGGYVVPGSLHEQASTVRFVASDGTTRLTVVVAGGVPSLFREGQGVVVEGAYAEDGAFHADTVLVKHNGEYGPPASGETPGPVDIDLQPGG